MDYNFSAIIKNFKTGQVDFEVKAFGSGHINDTFLVKSANNSTDYLLQRINNYVFKDVEGLTDNVLAVTNHLKLKLPPDGNPYTQVLTFIECSNGKYFYLDAQGNYWRMSYFLHDTQSYDVVTTTEQAYQGGMAFGKFQADLSDLDPSGLIDTIPDFLNVEKRLNDLHAAIQNDKVNRKKNTKEEIDFLISREAIMSELLKWGREGLIPLRITHNDTKFNNILLDKDNRIQCVIDLDTVMPGYVAYDFGDALRTIINTAAEDEKELSAIQLNIPLFAEFTRGYLSQTLSFLTEQELHSLIKGVLLLPYLQSVRFLTDYLEGDVYYKTLFTEHNLQRTRAQVQLLKMIEEKQEELKGLIVSEWLNLKGIQQLEQLQLKGPAI
jgi:hypothetical protein